MDSPDHLDRFHGTLAYSPPWGLGLWPGVMQVLFILLKTSPDPKTSWPERKHYIHLTLMGLREKKGIINHKRVQLYSFNGAILKEKKYKKGER